MCELEGDVARAFLSVTAARFHKSVCHHGGMTRSGGDALER